MKGEVNASDSYLFNLYSSGKLLHGPIQGKTNRAKA